MEQFVRMSILWLEGWYCSTQILLLALALQVISGNAGYPRDYCWVKTNPLINLGNKGMLC
jgi:hypothetical protein